MTDEEKKKENCDCEQAPDADPDQATEGDRKCAKELADETPSSLPPIDFSTFMYSMSTQALMLMGEANLPGMEQPPKDLNAAKQTIGIIEMLETKTKGNLTDSEAKLLSNLLYDLRVRYVKANRG